MKNDSKSISANEINKFAYCPYQWYYERYFGATYIRALYKERNRRLGLKDFALSNFKKGQDFHSDYETAGSDSGLFKFIRVVAVIIAVIAGIVGGYLFYLNFL